MVPVGACQMSLSSSSFVRRVAATGLGTDSAEHVMSIDFFSQLYRKPPSSVKSFQKSKAKLP